MTTSPPNLTAEQHLERARNLTRVADAFTIDSDNEVLHFPDFQFGCITDARRTALYAGATAHATLAMADPSETELLIQSVSAPAEPPLATDGGSRGLYARMDAASDVARTWPHVHGQSIRLLNAADPGLVNALDRLAHAYGHLSPMDAVDAGLMAPHPHSSPLVGDVLGHATGDALPRQAATARLEAVLDGVSTIGFALSARDRDTAIVLSALRAVLDAWKAIPNAFQHVVLLNAPDLHRALEGWPPAPTDTTTGSAQ